MHKYIRSTFLFAMLVVLATALSLYGQGEDKSQISGTLVDLSCYAKGGFLTNDHGGMKGCGSMCARAGLPVAVVDAEKKVHVLAAPAPGYADYIAKQVRITGKVGKNADVFIPEKLEIKDGDQWVEKDLPKAMM